MKIPALVAAAIAFSFVAAPALGEQELSREALIAAMVSEGAPEEQATCLVDALGEDAGRIIGAVSEPSEEDMAKLEEAFASCASAAE